MRSRVTFIVCLIACCFAASVPLIASGSETGAQLFEGLGTYHRTFTASSDDAKQYLNQGMIWLQAFNYDEADRSFREAARLDPECAMAWWGVAVAAGPSYNHPQMNEQRVETCRDAIQNAQARIDNTSPVERALIEALGTRFEMPYPMDDDSHLDQAYADALGKIWEQFPQDADIGNTGTFGGCCQFVYHLFFHVLNTLLPG